MVRGSGNLYYFNFPSDLNVATSRDHILEPPVNIYLHLHRCVRVYVYILDITIGACVCIYIYILYNLNLIKSNTNVNYCFWKVTTITMKPTSVKDKTQSH